ncbi:MAG: ATP-binding protein [Methanothrix sp.]|nr:ATP-binding protein [Methanothrix sp.]
MSDKPIVLEPVYEKPTLCIVGDPGAGKTRLASLWPDPYFLDTEGGAGSAVPKERRVGFDVSGDMVAQVKKKVQELAALPYHDRRIFLNDMPIGGVVIDTLDAAQQVHKYMSLLKGGTYSFREPRQMWGKLLDDFILLVFETKKIPVPVIWVAHAKIEEPIYDIDGGIKRNGWRGIAVQGSIEEQIVRWFDYCLHIIIEEDFARKCLTQPTIYKGYRILSAKDRHDTFKTIGKRSFTISVDEATGFPVTQALQVIYDRHIY